MWSSRSVGQREVQIFAWKVWESWQTFFFHKCQKFLFRLNQMTSITHPIFSNCVSLNTSSSLGSMFDGLTNMGEHKNAVLFGRLNARIDTKIRMKIKNQLAIAVWIAIGNWTITRNKCKWVWSRVVVAVRVLKGMRARSVAQIPTIWTRSVDKMYGNYRVKSTTNKRISIDNICGTQNTQHTHSRQ